MPVTAADIEAEHHEALDSLTKEQITIDPT